MSLSYVIGQRQKHAKDCNLFEIFLKKQSDCFISNLNHLCRNNVNTNYSN